MATLAGYLTALKLRHFSPAEFTASDNRYYTDPPESLWPNIALTAIVLDALREAVGYPVRITSCYRNVRHNRDVGGTVRSNHPAFTAIDFQVLVGGRVQATPQRKAAATLREWRGRVFELPFPVVRVRHLTPAGGVPFAPIATWDLRGHMGTEGGHGREPMSLMRFRGGIGEYRTFTHLDTRGLDHSWRGSG